MINIGTLSPILKEDYIDENADRQEPGTWKGVKMRKIYTFNKSLNMEVENISKGDVSLITVPDNLKVPVALLNAVDKIIAMGFVPKDVVVLDLYNRDIDSQENLLCNIGYEEGNLIISWHNLEDKAHVDKMRAWKNFDCVWYYRSGKRYLSKLNLETEEKEFVMKFLTDLFMFLNPDINIDDLCVSLDFSNVADQLGIKRKGEKFECEFFPDGSESSPQQEEKCRVILQRYIDQLTVL